MDRELVPGCFGKGLWVALLVFLATVTWADEPVVVSDSLASDSTLADTSRVDSAKIGKIHADTARADTSSLSWAVVEIDIRSKAIAVLAWPFEYVLQPVFGLLMYPMVPPLQYISENDLIDKGVRLISFGSKNEIFIYPTFNMKPGSASSIGAAFRYRNMIFAPDYFVASQTLYANGDWQSRMRYSKSRLLGSEMWTGFSYKYNVDRDNGFTIPHDKAIIFADTSFNYRVFLGNPLGKGSKWSWELTTGIDLMRTDLPDVEDSILSADHPFGRYQRGIYQDFNQYPVGLALAYDTRDFSAAPTSGSKFNANVYRVWVSDYSGPNSENIFDSRSNHDFTAIELKWQHYLLIGKQQYAMTTHEGKENLRQIRNMSLSKAMAMFQPEQIRQTLLERKVIVTQIRFRQMWEDEEGMAPYTAFSRLGGSYPLRAYPDGRFTDYATIGLSNEYRWPVDRLVDGVVFNEYGIYSRSWQNFSSRDLVNSWGFGIRVRKPDFFLTRLQFAFHGTQGISMIMTINPAYD